MKEIVAYIISNPIVFFSIGGLGLFLVALSIYKKSQETKITYEKEEESSKEIFYDTSQKDLSTKTTTKTSSPVSTEESGDNGTLILNMFNNLAVLVMSIIIYVIGYRSLTRENSPWVAFAICYGAVYCVYNFIIKPSIFKNK